MSVFDIFNRKSLLQHLLDVAGTNLDKINAALLADEKARGMIAKAIAKSEIIISNGSECVENEMYFRLNIQPNDNQSGTEFWYNVVMQLLGTGEAIVATVKDKLYLVTAYTADAKVFNKKRYTNITVTDGSHSFQLKQSFYSDDLWIFRYENSNIREYRSSILNAYNDTLQALTQIVQLSNKPIFKYKITSPGAFRKQNKDGTTTVLTIDEVIAKLKSDLSEKDLTIITESNGVELVYMDLPNKSSASDINALANTMNSQAAMCYDIPSTVYTGTITEKSDATNEFITYAAQPIAEVISDQLNAKAVGEDGYIKGERIYVWTSNFKHVDVIDAASSLDKLRGIGFTLDEIFKMVGYPAINTEFSAARALTKNYSSELTLEGGEGNA